MGINQDSVEFLRFARSVGVSFESTATIGRQSWFAKPEQVRKALVAFGEQISLGEAQHLVEGGGGFADLLFGRLGAREVAAVDMSDFEGATILHDMNLPIEESLNDRFTCVFDGGALEHVFNFPTAIENCMKMVRPGGHLLAIVVLNNQVGHGFYQFSPELYFRVLSPANGFEVAHLFIRDEGLRGSWIRVTDPVVLGRRTSVSTTGEAVLCVIAKRIGDARINETPQQSDYDSRWQAHDSKVDYRATASTRAERIRQSIYRALGERIAPRVRSLRISIGTAASTPGMVRIDLPKLAKQPFGES